MYYELSKEEMAQIESFANEQTSELPIETLTHFQSLYWAVQRQINKKLKSLETKNASLQSRIERIKNKEEKNASEGIFAERSIDSVIVAKAVLYYLQVHHNRNINKSKINAILFEMYSTWLADNHERIFIEHPKATQFGPQFWRAYNHIDINKIVMYVELKDFAENNPDLMAFIKNVTNKYSDYPTRTLAAKHMGSPAYINAKPDEKKGEKWTKELSDADIYRWKKSI